MDNTPSTGLIEQTKELLHAVRGSLIKVAQNLYIIKQGVPEGEWGSLCESELGISQSFASKLLTVNRVYILEGGVSPEKLEGVDYETLYLARNLSGSVEERLAKAQTLSRSELKAERNEELPHEHEWIQICKKCSVRHYE